MVLLYCGVDVSIDAISRKGAAGPSLVAHFGAISKKYRPAGSDRAVAPYPEKSAASGAQPVKRGAVTELDPPRRFERDDPRLHKMGKGSGHRLDRQTQIIGNVLPRHRQL